MFRQIRDGEWKPTNYIDEFKDKLKSLRLYYSENVREEITNLFITTNTCYTAEEFKPNNHVDIDRGMIGTTEFQNWINQVFPEVASNFGLTLYAYSYFE